MNVSTPVRRCLSAPAFIQPQSSAIRRRFIALLTAGLCGLTGAGELLAATYSYDRGPSTTGADWGVAENWSSDTVPGALDNAWFSIGVTISMTVNLGSSREVAQLYFNQSNATWTIGSADDVTAGNTLTVASVKRDTAAGATQTIRANIVLSASNSLWEINSGYNNGLTALGSISGVGKRIDKWGGGLLTLSGANTFDGGISVNMGTLGLDFGPASAPTSNILASSNTLTIGNASLTATGKGGAAVSQTLAGTSLASGNASFSIVNGSAANTRTLINLGVITRAAGATINFTQPTGSGSGNSTVAANNGFSTSTANDASGILGGYATVGTEWATNNGTNIVAYAGYADLAGATPSLVDAPSSNVRVTSGSTGDVGQSGGTTTVNTIRVNDSAARTITIGTGNTLRVGAVGGILSTGTGGLTIGASGNAGRLTAGGSDNTAGELFVNNATALTINSTIADNGTGAVSLIKTGAGTATLAAATAHTGGTIVNQGVLQLTAANTLTAGSPVSVDGGTLNLGAFSHDFSGSLIVSGGSFNPSSVVVGGGTISNGTINKTGAAIDARGGVISAQITGSAGINKTTLGAFSFSNTANNTFTGTTTISEGAVRSGAGGNFIAVSGDLVVGSIDGVNGASYNAASNTVTFASARNLTVYSNGAVNFGNANQYLSGNVSIIGGSLGGTAVYQQTTVQLTGGTWAAATYGNNNSFTTNASSQTSLISGSLNLAGGKTMNVADGSAAVDLRITGNVAGTGSAFVKDGAGTLEMIGNKGYTGVTTVNAGVLAADSLSNGGSSSSIGGAAAAAANLLLRDGSTFRYIGSGHSTDRLFAVGSATDGQSATLEASGTGAANFTNTGSVAWGTAGQTRTLKLGGTNTANNTLAALIANNGSGIVSLTKQDSGKWVLSNANTYTGATTVSNGRLALDVTGAIAATSALNIGAAGVFDVSAKSSYALGTGGVKIAIGSGSAGFFDAGAAAVTLGNTLTLDFTGSIVAGTYNLFDFGSHTGDFSGVNVTGSIVGSLINSSTDTWTGNVGGYGLNFSEATGLLNVSAVPEPSTYALFGGALILGYAVYRRHSRRQVA